MRIISAIVPVKAKDHDYDAEASLPERIRVMITDNLAIVWAGLRTLVDDRSNNAGLVGQSDGCSEPVWRAHLLRPGVILVNLVVSPQNGDQAIDVIQMRDPRACILAPSELIEDDRAVAAIKAALCAFLRHSDRDRSAEPVPGVLRDREFENLPFAHKPVEIGPRV